MAQLIATPRHCCKKQPDLFRRAAPNPHTPNLVQRKRSVMQPLAAHHRRWDSGWRDDGSSRAFNRAATTFMASTLGELLQQIEKDWGVTVEAKTPDGASATAKATASATSAKNVYPIDSMETDEDIVYYLDVPGLDKSDLKIQVNQMDRTMTVSGERFHPVPTQDPEIATTKHINKFERAFGTFSRTVTLPESADSQLISAKVDKGVLRIKVLKQIKAEPDIQEVEID